MQRKHTQVAGNANASITFAVLLLASAHHRGESSIGSRESVHSVGPQDIGRFCKRSCLLCKRSITSISSVSGSSETMDTVATQPATGQGAACLSVRRSRARKRLWALMSCSMLCFSYECWQSRFRKGCCMTTPETGQRIREASGSQSAATYVGAVESPTIGSGLACCVAASDGSLRLSAEADCIVPPSTRRRTLSRFRSVIVSPELALLADLPVSSKRRHVSVKDSVACPSVPVGVGSWQERSASRTFRAVRRIFAASLSPVTHCEAANERLSSVPACEAALGP